MNRLKYLLFCLPFLFVSCSSDNPDFPGGDLDKDVPDPDGTVTVSIYKNSTQNMDGIYINDEDYLVSKNGDWLFTTLGPVHGLGNISDIPTDGWTDKIACEVNSGYVAYKKGSINVFRRFFVSNSAKDDLGTYTGYQIKYQTPFYGNDEDLQFEKTTFNVSDDSEIIIPFLNSTIIPIKNFTFSEGALYTGYVLNDDLIPIGVKIIMPKSSSLEPITYTAEVETFYNKTYTLTFLRAAKTPTESTITIADLKKKYWKDSDNYATQLSDYVIRGHITSSDYAGNIYKQIMVEDETGAIAFAVNGSNLYLSYNIGQDVSITLNSDMYIGKYAGLMQIGDISYTSSFGENVSYMSLDTFRQAADCNGYASGENTSYIETTIAELNNAITSSEELRKYQSRYVKLSKVAFAEALSPYANYHETTNRTLYDANGNSIIVRNNGYSNFYSQPLPEGSGDVYAIVSTYNDKMQLILNSSADVRNFDSNASLPPFGGSSGDGTMNGTEEYPYNVATAMSIYGASADAWVIGYIVGWVDTTFYNYLCAENCNFSANASSANIILLAASPKETDYKNCLPVQLMSGTTPYDALNLCDNPQRFQSHVKVYGTITKFLGVAGIKGVSNYSIVE